MAASDRKPLPSSSKLLQRRVAEIYADRRPILLLAVRFCVGIAIFAALSQSDFYQQCARWLACEYASWAAVVLRAGGAVCYSAGPTLFWYTTSILNVGPTCAALEFSVFLFAAILAFPAPGYYRLLGMGLGFVSLQVMNLVRIVSLYLVGLHAPPYFDLLHNEVWSAIFVVATVLFTLGWIASAPTMGKEVHVLG